MDFYTVHECTVHLQALQNKVLTQLVDLAGAYHTMATNRDEQIQELEKEIEHRDTQIGQLQGQVQERDTLMGERNATIADMEEQIHDLNLELDDVMDHIEWHLA